MRTKRESVKAERKEVDETEKLKIGERGVQKGRGTNGKVRKREEEKEGKEKGEKGTWENGVPRNGERRKEREETVGGREGEGARNRVKIWPY